VHVVHLAAEATPWAKTGGLGDVVGALPAALARAGVRTTVCIPGHRSVMRAVDPRATPAHVVVPISSRTEGARVVALRDAPIPTMAVDAPRYFDRAELYGEGGRDYADNAERFVFFCRAALEWLGAAGEAPDVVHVHDWQAALAPVFLRADAGRYPALARTRSVCTVHNLAYQGRFWAPDWHLLSLDGRFFHPDHLEFYGDINFLKGGIVFADVVTTVSPRYADEIRTPAFGELLDGVLRARGPDVRGILNGIDTAVWNPATDPALAARYDRADPRAKARCKAALQAEVGLAERSDVPLLATITRLAAQKGVDLLLDVAGELLPATDAQLVVLGSGDPALERALGELRDRFPGRVALRLGFDDPLAHRIEAGSDAFLMPSRYEPCGLSQLYSQRYGTVPIVHATGGLVDTVADYDAATGRGTGFVFAPFTRDAFLAAIHRALEVWRDRPRWNALVEQGMAMDFSWDRSAARYRALYEEIAGRPSRG
jgi:starch synthase